MPNGRPEADAAVESWAKARDRGDAGERHNSLASSCTVALFSSWADDGGVRRLLRADGEMRSPERQRAMLSAASRRRRADPDWVSRRSASAWRAAERYRCVHVAAGMDEQSVSTPTPSSMRWRVGLTAWLALFGLLWTIEVELFGWPAGLLGWWPAALAASAVVWISAWLWAGVRRSRWQISLR